MSRSASIAILGTTLVSLLCGCPGELDEPSPCDITYDILNDLRVDEVTYLSPVIDGTRFSVRGESFIAGEICVVPQVSITCGRDQVTLDGLELLSPNDLVASLPALGVASLGSGGACTLAVAFASRTEARTFVADAPVTIELAQELTPVFVDVEQNEAYLNDSITLIGDGFLDGHDEGTTTVEIEGQFLSDSGSSTDVSGVTLAVELVGEGDRTRGTLLWSPLIAGLSPGVFSGTITPHNVSSGQTVTSGAAFPLDVAQRETIIFGFSPQEISLGSVVDVNGRGFIGSSSGASDQGTTSFRLEGWLTPCTGGPGQPLNCDHDPEPVGVDLGGQNVELVGEWVSGTSVRFPITVSNNGGYLHAVSFQVHRGTFEGSITPVLRVGGDVRDGIPVTDVTITLGPVRQIAWVRFLPGFSTSLDFFGLGALEAEIRERIVTRMQEIYHPPGQEREWINVEFRTEEPQDVYPGAYAVLDIGGPDPNNMGLFGYDNTPGKDRDNLRLWDHVGGLNALGELDDHGYGGVFVESMLFWSDHPPPQIGDRPRGAPPPDALFDEIFDPVREQEVVAGEWPVGADDDRLREIERALSALSNMIADTAAHEFGHSLGLAQPTIPDRAYHNDPPEDGCLMNSGSHRPLVERTMDDGHQGARFCQENLWYLQDILPMD